MSKISKMVTATILSMSLLTVMAGAAIAPAMGIIRAHFAASPDLSVQLVISLPALFIILTNMAFFSISRVLRTRTIAVIGLALYVVAGTGCFLVEELAVLLVLRALLGVSVGLIMPLSTGLLSYFYPPEEQAHLMGLSAAMNQMGGVVGTLLAGLLAAIDWHYAFLVYLFGLVALLMVLRWLPNEQLTGRAKKGDSLPPRRLLRFHPSVVGMFLLTVVFFVFPTNFAIITGRQLQLGTTTITLLMVALDLIAFLAGLWFGRLMERFSNVLKFFPPLALMAGYGCYAEADGIGLILIGSALIGMANGVGVPYLLTIASIKAGREAATTVMPLLSAALYLGQFLSPILILPLAEWMFGASVAVGPYKVSVLIAGFYLLQVWLTRNFQSLPPVKSGRS